MFGGNFRKTITHNILVGFKPQMNQRDQEWLDAHNTRRKEYHEESNLSFKPLTWSPELAEDASRWVDMLLPTCELIREKNVEEGENVSFRLSKFAMDTEYPDNILKRWADTKADKGYPANESFTQVMWRSTRYLGCSDKVEQYENGSYCYVSICRYARAGNCNIMGYQSWEEPTLADHTSCGSACPAEGCH